MYIAKNLEKKDFILYFLLKNFCKNLRCTHTKIFVLIDYTKQTFSKLASSTTLVTYLYMYYYGALNEKGHLMTFAYSHPHSL
jgi:hypothetical protein